MTSEISEITNQSGKIAIVTGANTGLGYETSLGLARAGCTVIMACRTQEKAHAAMAEIKRDVADADLIFLSLDLIDRGSIKEFVAEFSGAYERLDILINNAGVMGPPHTITQNGLELQFDANHLGHFYLTHLLMDKLDKGHDARVVNVSSLAGKFPEADIFFDNLNFEGNYEEGPEFMGLKGMLAYAQSKLANILFTLELRDRFEKAEKPIKSLVVHPGASNTDLSRNMSIIIRVLAPILVKFMNISTPAEGAQSSLYATLTPDVETGAFIGPSGKEERTGKPGPCAFPPIAENVELRQKLWALSEELLGIKFEV